MTKKEKLVWRLGKLPTPDELRELVKDKIITQDEAREILFNVETEETRDKDSLHSEIKFLRELVEKLSDKSKVVKVIKEIHTPYQNWQWYQPYYSWCGNENYLSQCQKDITSQGSIGNQIAGITNCSNSSLSDLQSITSSNDLSFSKIQTL